MQLADMSHVTTAKALRSTSVRAPLDLPQAKTPVHDLEKLLTAPDNNAQPEKQLATTALKKGAF